MASRKAVTVFHSAINNDRLMKQLTDIAMDDRWHKGQERFNREIADWAFQWAKQAFEYSRDKPSKTDAKLVLQIAMLALEWPSR